ncbi:hypothetical protein [Sharpea azabuensis]|uniref:hypothetical protein n=1 Tax=Sharpea azabuensis TaxID=322505 RepID=UPI0015693148|nr:hypothetical protein [Sharpea azabuensis]
MNGKLAELDLSGLKPLDIVDAAKEKKTRLPKDKQLPKDKRSLSSNWWIDSLGVLGGLGQAIGAATQKIKRTNTYRSNPYERLALNKLASLRVDPYPIMKEVYD